MTFYAFTLLSNAVQLYWVLHHGTFLANRWEQESSVNLYHCAGEGQQPPIVLRSFVSSVPLEDYTYGVQLPYMDC